MSYQVLARKWRPQNFKEMVGQEHVLKALIHALEQQRLHHAYLFTGTRGVGKTTIGRILAKCLNCESGITAEPCGQCSACLEIAEGRFVDLIEIDAASRTKVEDMRELLDNVQYAPTRGRFKVYLIDEVHMLSTTSFNALLKTLEEPPEHVKFLLATTDPQKLPVTILSRCLQFNLKNMPADQIVSHLTHILTVEKVDFTEQALWLLARAANGSMRDALSLTDQAIGYGNHKLIEEEVSAMLGTVDQQQVFGLLDALVKKQPQALLDAVSAMAEFSPDYAEVMAQLASVLHRITIEQVVPGATTNAMGDKEKIVGLARQLTPEDVQLYYQITLMGRKDLDMTPDPRMGLEMTLLRMLAFTPEVEQAVGATQQQSSVVEDQVASDEPTAKKTETVLENNVDTGQAKEASPAVEIPQAQSLQGSQINETPVTTMQMPAPEPEQTSSADVPPWVSDQLPEASEEDYVNHTASDDTIGSPDLSETKSPEAESEAVSLPVTTASKHAESANWVTDVHQMGLTGLTHNLACHTVLNLTGDAIELAFEEEYYPLFNEYSSQNHKSVLIDALKARYGDKPVNFVCGITQGETPEKYAERIRMEKQAEAEKQIAEDPVFNDLVSHFNGRIIKDSIKPRIDM